MRLAVVLLLGLFSAGADGTGRNVRGVVADQSGGVLPGVTVVAHAPDGRVLTTTVTDGSGRYSIGPLAPGRVTVTFQLEGFADVTEQIALGADADAVVNKRLGVAPRSETVEVYGKIPVTLPLPAPPPPPRPTPPRPRPATTAVPEHDRDSVCGPARLDSQPASSGTIHAKRSAANLLYSQGDELTIDGGTASGLQVGGNFVVRRTFRVEWDPRTEIGEHTAGLVQIAEASETTATAVVIYACDEMLPGDRLVPFAPQPRRIADAEGKPDYKHAVKILFPDLGQLLGAPRRMMVIDSGTTSGVRVGQRVTVFRRRLSDNAPSDVGDAVVVAVRQTSATIRVDRVTDAIFSGDLAALQR